MIASRANPLSARTIMRTFLPHRRRITGTTLASAELGLTEKGQQGATGLLQWLREKRVQTAEGTIELQVPKIRKSLEPFDSVRPRAIGKRYQHLLELMPML